MRVQMVDLKNQFAAIEIEVQNALKGVLTSTQFIKGPYVKRFEDKLATYLNCKHIIGCGNGTDALQIALMALDLEVGDEVILPAFTYVATAEVVALLKLKPVLVDVEASSFNISVEAVKKKITNKTKAIIPVHLFGQSADMEALMQLADQHGIHVVEDNAQAIGADFLFSNGEIKKTGTIGHIGTTSFYPSKNLGAYGDGGALSCNDLKLAKKIRMIANHGQNKTYYHQMVGVNSRLDALQAAILSIKLKYLNDYIQKRQEAAAFYDAELKDLAVIAIPQRSKHSTHVFHQYTIKVNEADRDQLKTFLKDKGIASMIYYPLPLYEQNAYRSKSTNKNDFPNTEKLCSSVLSLPMHTEMTPEILHYICQSIKAYYNQ